MEVLRPREQEVLSLRFGLGGRERLSLSQVGRLLEVSKERVRQIQDRALEKLRAGPRSRTSASGSPWPISAGAMRPMPRTRPSTTAAPVKMPRVTTEPLSW